MPETVLFKSVDFILLNQGILEKITTKIFYETDGGIFRKLPGEETKKEIIPITIISYLSNVDLFLNSIYLSYINKFLDGIYRYK